MSSGTGASGAAVAAFLAGAVKSPVTVQLDGGELEVEISDDLDVRLSGWAERVYAGELSPEFVRTLSDL
jgi:diaminopimelate epimerase